MCVYGKESNTYVNVKKYGCKYDGITDDSEKLMNSKSDYLYFPKGDISLTSEAVIWLLNKNVKGEGCIQISDFYKFPNSKYSDNGEIMISDLQNEYIGSLNLPNEQYPDTDFGHQKYNGWINPYTIISDEYSFDHLTCWGQVYPVDGVEFSNGDEKITICISKMKFMYYDEISGLWVYTNEEKVPLIYGFYDRNYKSVDKGGKKILGRSYMTIVDCGDYLEITFPYKYIEGRVLHFGLNSKYLPTDKELYVIGEYNVWVKDEEHNEKFVANVGIDIYGWSNEKKVIKEYCGSRYKSVKQSVENICIAYVDERYDLLRLPKEYFFDIFEYLERMNKISIE